MSKPYVTLFDDEFLGSNDDKYSLRLLLWQLDESLNTLTNADFICYREVRSKLKEDCIKKLILRLYQDRYIEEDFVKFIDKLYEHRNLMCKTIRQLNVNSSKAESKKVIKKAKFYIRELNEYTHDYYGKLFFEIIEN
ncbi:MAG: hypothetical protein E7180_06655 [Erysipelotrichaceae bacterium]|nr:hypothetical protein [Erysipelotrichaceae bacterium]